MSSISLYQKEQDEVIEKFLEEKIIKYWQKDFPERQEGPFDLFLEIYITASCNQKCTYCYLTNHGEELYPLELRDKDTILKNLEIVYKYLAKRKVILSRLDFFSGEIWGTSFGDQILNMTLKYICNSDLDIRSIVIPTNFSFCQSIDKMTKMDKYINAFAKVNCLMQLSCSIDGLVVDNLNRPLNSDINKTNEFYSNVFSFVKKHGFGFHPMIAANNIEYQCDNYDAWIAAFKQVYGNDPKNHYGLLMQLEVRNDDWTEEKILEYCKWLNHVMDVDKKEYFNDDHKSFQHFLLTGGTDGWSYKFSASYNPYRLLASEGPYAGLCHCTMGTMVAIRLGDLSIVPCHRTSYEKFLLGKIKVENDEIVGVEAKNISLLNSTYRSSYAVKPKCDTCFFEKYCLRGCLGSQYESTGDIHYPIDSVCELQQAKIIFLFEKLQHDNYFDDEVRKNPQFKYFIDYYTELKETKEYKKWQPLIQKKIF